MMSAKTFIYRQLGLIIALGLFPVLAYAAVQVDSNFTGTLVITSSNGDINLLESGDSIPEIDNGSILEVFDGEFTVSVGQGDSVEASCLEHTASLSAAGSIKLSCGETQGLLTVLRGNVQLADPGGNLIQLTTGQTYVISLASPLAAPTAQGDGPGSSIDAGDDAGGDVDSTNIDVQDNLSNQISP